jgi:1-acyl-sn-glycerol-3-phosphate acyltransferase
MPSFIPAPLRGIISALLLTLNTLFWCLPLFALILLKLVLPFVAMQKHLLNGLHWVAESWMACNGRWMDFAGRIHWDICGLENLQRDKSYLLISNHQSWVDIMALLYPLNRHAPFYKFFLKQNLFWVPILGLAWWALEYPFMKRYSKEYLSKYPEKQGQDLTTTRAACERYKDSPVTVINYVEGTRFTPAKHAQQQSPYRHLLKPRAGGVALVLDAMGEQLDGIVNATLAYPGGRPTFWQLMCGQIGRISLYIELLEVPGQFLDRSYSADAAYREEFQTWINQVWQAKDELLSQLQPDA